MLRLSIEQKRRVMLADKKLVMREITRERLLYIVDILLETVAEDIPDDIIAAEWADVHAGHLKAWNSGLYVEESPE